MIFCACNTKPDLVSDGDTQRVCHVCKRVPAPNDSRVVHKVDPITTYTPKFQPV